MYDIERTMNLKSTEWTFENPCLVNIEADVPEKLYRYTQRKWAENLVTEGSFRLGTLYGYREQENHRDGRLDIFEGTQSFTLCLPDGSIFGPIAISQDAWILCLSSDLNPDLLKRFDEANDTIVEIDVKGFFYELTRKLAGIARCASFRKIQYLEEDDLDMEWPFEIDENRMFNDPDYRPCVPISNIIKRKQDFSWQKEWRIILEPIHYVFGQKPGGSIDPHIGVIMNGFGVGDLHEMVDKISPITPRVPELAKHCRILDI